MKERSKVDFYTLSGIHISLLLSGFLFELHDAEVHYASSQLAHTHLLLRSEAQDIKYALWTHKYRGKRERERGQKEAQQQSYTKRINSTINWLMHLYICHMAFQSAYRCACLYC